MARRRTPELTLALLLPSCGDLASSAVDEGIY